ncbi:MAG: cytochrome c biogenesis protein CcsA [bacterium]|nr:cytochrome c biogenesis protein CcsA [bacterium]
MFSFVIHVFSVLTTVFYAGASVLYLRALRTSDSEERQFARGRKMLLGGFLAHGCYIAQLYLEAFISHDYRLVMSLPHTVSLVSFIVLSLFFAAERKLQWSAFAVFIAPAVTFLFLLSSVLLHLQRGESIPAPRFPGLAFHILSVVCADVAFVLAFGASLSILLQDYLLKRRKINYLIRHLPSLRTMDRFNIACLVVGFSLMLLGVISGLSFVGSMKIDMLVNDMRLLSSFLVLIAYALVLLARFYFGWKGRRIAALSSIAFVFVLASFIAVGFLGRTFHVH